MIATWQDALDYLYGLANWETRPPGTPATFELDRIRQLLSLLGDPHLRWPAVHVAGTNGKGSTCVMLAGALRRAGYRVGLYTSPHLHTARERVCVDGTMLDARHWIEWLERHRALLDAQHGLTTFEALTALAFDTFAAAEVDVAVVEVGLGGRLDTTNVVRPAVSVITPIGLDHTRVLGSTVAEIATDKAGIVRAGVTAVVAPQPPEARAALDAAAATAHSRARHVTDVARWTAGGCTDAGASLTVHVARASGERCFDLDLALRGRHQHVNAVTATVALGVLADAGWAIDDAAIAAGVSSARWPARFEVLADAPVLVVDGAHNPPAAAALADALDDCLPGVRRCLLLGCSLDKDVCGILAHLLPGASRVIATRSEHPRALATSELAAAVRAMGVSCDEAHDPASALDLALRACGASDAIVAAGSLFLAADVREAWAARGQMPMPPRDPPPAVPRAG